MRVLITGGAGFIGTHIARALLARGSQVVIMDSFSRQVHQSDSLNEDIASQVELHRGDIRSQKDLEIALKGVTNIIHLAAETGTGQSMYKIGHYFDVNVQGTANLLHTIQNSKHLNRVKSIVVASSRAIYGEGAYRCNSHGLLFPDERLPSDLEKGIFDPICPICRSKLRLEKTSENALFKPTSIYGLTKQIQEQMVLLFCKTTRIKGISLRYQNVYGPGQSLINPYTGILAIFSNLARGNSPIQIFEDGNESRDFVYVTDVVEATVNSLYYAGDYVGPINIGYGSSLSVYEVASLIKLYFKSTSDIHINGVFRVGDIRHNVADISLAKKLLGWEPKVDFKSGLNNFLGWTKTQKFQGESAYKNSISELSSMGLIK